jgi:hypothetical protein
MTEVGIQQTTAETRIQLHEYLRWFSAEIVTAADGVLVTERDLAIQEAALRLKANAVTSMQTAVFQHDPLAALTDAWALTAAMTRFFEDGNGRGLYGGSQTLVVDALRRLEIEVDQLAQRIAGKERVDAVRPQLQRFVLDNPIRDLSFGRRSAGLRASTLTAAAWSTDVRRSVAQLDETARDVSDRLTIYAEQLPQIARWQGEILLIEAQREFMTKPFATIEGVDGKIGAIGDDIDTLTGFVTGTPALIANERALLLEALERERATILSSVDAQRVATLSSVDGQRVATLAALTAEREAILAAIAELRRASFTDLGTETARSLDRIDRLSATRVQDLSRMSNDVVDHLFWRALELLLVGVAAFAILALALRHRRPPASTWGSAASASRWRQPSWRSARR